MIRDDKIHQIYSQMQMGQEKYGMQTLNQSLFVHFHNRKISRETALSRSSDPDELLQMMANPGLGDKADETGYRQCRLILEINTGG